MGVEEDDPAGGNLQRTSLVVPLVPEVEQVLTEFVLGDLIGRLVEVGGELSDNAEIGCLRSLGEACQLQVLVHALTKRGAHVWALSKRKQEKPSGNPLWSSCGRRALHSPRLKMASEGRSAVRRMIP